MRFRVPAGEIVVDDLIRGPVVVGADAIGDFIIVRSDGVAGYNFASVVDDRDMGITHVIRGDDHLTNTARQLLLFAALGAPRAALRPPFAWCSGPDGGKLSKRHGATAVGDYRELGYLPRGDRQLPGPAQLVARRGRGARAWTAWSREFELERLSPSPAVFDQAKLDWLDHEHIMALAPEEHERLLRGAAAGRDAAAGGGGAGGRLPAVAGAPTARRRRWRPRCSSRRRAPPELARRASPPRRRSSRASARCAPRRRSGCRPPAARDLLAAYRAWGKERGIGARDLLMPLRIALTGAEHGPELPFVLAALEPRRDARARLDRRPRRERRR